MSKRSLKIHQSHLVVSSTMEDLCLDLAHAESEEEVIDILIQSGYWDNQKNWKFYGQNENNFSIIGNQQSMPESAIVEKLINSVDAILMRECLRKNIDPESKDAPGSIVEAQEEYFKIRKGSLWDISAAKRTEIAQNIMFVSSGKKSNPCYSIIDMGEGQTPEKFPKTFLSLSESNKLRIRFVQGKFNMGGTGVLQFAGRHNLQLIISKRDPRVTKYEDDNTKEYWGFTVVRRENPSDNRKSSTYTYLVINGNIPMFKKGSLPLLPGTYPNPYGLKMKWGTFIKLYEYQMPGLKTNILLDLYNRICLLVPRIALPVRFCERRKGYSAHSYEATMSGLDVRLSDDKRENLEDGFPSSSTISVSGERMACQIYAFKKDQSTKYRKDEGIIFSINGQTHGHISKSFFSRRTVRMGYLADSILVSIDCSAISGRTREDLFMNSRDRLRSGGLKREIENELAEILRNHQGLKELRTRRRQEELHDKLADSKPLQDIINDLMKKSPSFASILFPGSKVANPFDLRPVASKEKYVGKTFPTYFKIKQKNIKKCPINRRCRIQFETDAANDYFERNTFSGDFLLFNKSGEVTDYSLNLWNGLANLTVNLPVNSKVGDVIDFLSSVSDDMRIEPFENSFKIEIIEQVKNGSKQKRKRKKPKPPSEDKGKEREVPSKLSLPNIVEVFSQEWEHYGFDQFSALMVKDTGEEGYDFYVNMDNSHLLSEIKINTGIEPQMFQEKYKIALVIVGMALLNINESEENDIDDDKTENIEDVVKKVTRQLSPVLLPMISYLGELTMED